MLLTDVYAYLNIISGSLYVHSGLVVRKFGI